MAQSTNPVDAAARFVLNKHPYYRGLGQALLVDTAGLGLRDRTLLSPASREVARGIAAELGARTGVLPDVMVCPDGPPPVHPFPQTCRLLDGVKAVLQVEDMEEGEHGRTVWVLTWIYQPNPDRGTYHVDATALNIQVEPLPGGGWRAIRWVEGGHAMW